MSLLHLPDAPVDERNSFKQRILKKYEAFVAKQAAGRTNAIQDQGERYEIAVALYLYRNHLVNKGEYLSRWTLPGEISTQSINMGADNEYDFVLADNHGLMLGDAKSESSGLGVYLKKAVSYCLMDYHVRNRENWLSGFCFATPSDPAAMFRTGLRNSLEILTTLAECSGITGMNSALIPLDVKLYFRNRYLVNGRIMRMDALMREQDYYIRELREHAGFTFQFLQVAAMDQTELARQMQMLSVKARWATP
jgi:hypothetical protein